MHAWAALVRRRGGTGWDLLIRATAVAGACGIPVVVLVPAAAPLVWLAILSIPANSPLSPVIPTAFEPVIMEAAKFESPLRVTVVALGAYLYMEYLNWHAYAWVLNWRRFEQWRTKRWVARAVTEFARRPWATVVVFAVTPLPFWVARCLAILHGYPVRRFLTATAVGRFPRLLFYAWFGAILRVPLGILLGLVVAGTVMALALRLRSLSPARA